MNLQAKGIKCDFCDWEDISVTAEQYESYINKPCPSCGDNLLRQEDFNAYVVMTGGKVKQSTITIIINLLNKLLKR